MRQSLAALTLVVCLVAACEDDPLRPPGSIAVVLTTTGVDADASYELRAGGRAITVASTVQTVEIYDVRAGTHQVVLGDLAGNCTVAGGASRSVSVTSGAATSVEFAVACVAVTGVLNYSVLLTGDELDADGFTVRVNTGGPQVLMPNVQRFVSGLPAGDVTLTLSGIATNCTVGGANPRVVRVNTGGAVRDTARTIFQVTCVRRPGDVRVTVQTIGADLDADGYTIFIGGVSSGAIASNGTATVSFGNGSYAIQLGGIAGNCAATGGASKPVTILTGAVTDVHFEIVCAPITRIEVDVQTTGVDPDANGYAIAVQGPEVNLADHVAASGTVVFAPLRPAAYTVSIADVAPNCEVAGATSRTVTTTAGTTRLNLAVTCATLQMIAYAAIIQEDWDIFVSKADGSDTRRLTTTFDHEYEPSWSSSGRIAYTRQDAADNAEIYAMNADGSAQTRLTNNAAGDRSPVWSPDGTRIAFVSDRDGNREIYVMNADGSNVTRLTNSPLDDADPSWSPDGTKIAFARGACVPSCDPDVYVMDANGGNVVRLTDAGYSFQPAWSPDGTRIAFVRNNNACGADRAFCWTDIYVMSATGTNVSLVLTNELYNGSPAWSPTGTRLLVAVGWFDMMGSGTDLVVVRPDGSDLVTIRSGWYADGPVWRP